ncbi:hypothetical protein GCM10027431_05070 [Lysobacter rhizosphaerae]
MADGAGFGVRDGDFGASDGPAIGADNAAAHTSGGALCECRSGCKNGKQAERELRHADAIRMSHCFGCLGDSDMKEGGKRQRARIQPARCKLI